MTISSQIRTAGPFAGTGAIVSCPFSFKVFQASDLLVSTTDPSGVQAVLVLSVDYTVTLNADQNASPGGVVTTLAVLPLGYSLALTSNIPVTQPLSLTNTGGFYPRAIEDELDRLTILMQQQNFVSAGQTLRVPEIKGIPLLPVAASRANCILAFDAQGNPVAAIPASGSAADVLSQLLNSTDPTKGLNLVGLHLTGAGEVSGLAAPFLNLQVKGLKKNYGAKMDGVSNDYAAWLAATQASGKIIEIEDGTALLDFVGTAPIPQCAQIVGYGPAVSILQFGAGVTGQAIDAVGFLKMRDFKVRGSAVAGVGGIYHGKSAVWYGESHNVRVENFKGAGSWGMRVGDAQKCIIYHPYLDGNYDNLRFDRTSPAFPTSLDLVHPIVVNAQNVGLYVVDGDAMVVDAAVYDSNAKGAVVFMPRPGGTISGVELLWGRCEDNAATQDTATTDGVNRYQIIAGDGTAMGGATIRFAIRSAFFAPGASGARSILLNGSACAACDIIRPDLPNTVQIACLNDAYGDWSTEWNAALDYNSVVYDPNGRDRGPYGHLANYTPTFASSVGNYGASYSGVPTLTRSRYKSAGRTPRLDYNVGLQLLAVTPAWLSATLPPGWTLFSGADQEVAGRLTINTTPTPARFVFESASNLLKVYKADGTNFTSGAAVTFGLSAEIELQ